MLSEVRIRNLALFEAIDIELGSGLNVISGETGEGKSLLLAAVGLLLGVRARKSLVRSGCPEAVVEGRFLLDDASLPAARSRCDLIAPDAEEICVRRVVTRSGQSRAYLDGSLVPVGLLARLAEVLVDVHGQGDQLSLKRVAEQGRVLDRYANASGALAAWRGELEKWKGIAARLRDLDEEQEQLQDRRDLLRFHLRELDGLDPLPDEASRLRDERRLLSRAEEVAEKLRAGVWELGEKDGSVCQVVTRLSRGFPVDVSPHLDGLGERFSALAAEAEDLAIECRSALDGLEADPGRLEEIGERLTLYSELSRRHRRGEDELAGLRSELQAELDAIERPDELRCELEGERERAASRLLELGIKLQRCRSKAAGRLERAITTGLKGLRMPGARVSVEVPDAPSEDGFDPGEHGDIGPGSGRFWITTNKGEPPHPLEEIASGGESARILLALRGALAGHHRVPLLIFDEIDSGIGGRVGLPFGRRVAEIAEHHQVLLITHLPQVAAFAQRHLAVRKTVRGKRTRTEVHPLGAGERVAELAAMLGGGTAMKAAKAQAEALLSEAAQR